LSKLSYKDCKGKHVLIIGDVGTGKTVISRSLLEEAAKIEKQIRILDFAPPASAHGDRRVGGFLIKNSLPGITHCKSHEINTPRLSAKTPQELVQLADENRVITENMLKTFVENPSSVLFINDVSIHLQSGELHDLLCAMNYAETAILNGYMGTFLRDDRGTGISMREHSLMKQLAGRMDKVITLTENGGK
jgi:hypothetical protein